MKNVKKIIVLLSAVYALSIRAAEAGAGAGAGPGPDRTAGMSVSIPKIGSYIPTPVIIAVTVSQGEHQLEAIKKIINKPKYNSYQTIFKLVSVILEYDDVQALEQVLAMDGIHFDVLENALRGMTHIDTPIPSKCLIFLLNHYKSQSIDLFKKQGVAFGQHALRQLITKTLTVDQIAAIKILIKDVKVDPNNSAVFNGGLCAYAHEWGFTAAIKIFLECGVRFTAPIINQNDSDQVTHLLAQYPNPRAFLKEVAGAQKKAKEPKFAESEEERKKKIAEREAEEKRKQQEAEAAKQRKKEQELINQQRNTEKKLLNAQRKEQEQKDKAAEQQRLAAAEEERKKKEAEAAEKNRQKQLEAAQQQREREALKEAQKAQRRAEQEERERKNAAKKEAEERERKEKEAKKSTEHTKIAVPVHQILRLAALNVDQGVKPEQELAIYEAFMKENDTQYKKMKLTYFVNTFRSQQKYKDIIVQQRYIDFAKQWWEKRNKPQQKSNADLLKHSVMRRDAAQVSASPGVAAPQEPLLTPISQPAAPAIPMAMPAPVPMAGNPVMPQQHHQTLMHQPDHMMVQAGLMPVPGPIFQQQLLHPVNAAMPMAMHYAGPGNPVMPYLALQHQHMMAQHHPMYPHQMPFQQPDPYAMHSGMHQAPYQMPLTQPLMDLTVAPAPGPDIYQQQQPLNTVVPYMAPQAMPVQQPQAAPVRPTPPGFNQMPTVGAGIGVPVQIVMPDSVVAQAAAQAAVAIPAVSDELDLIETSRKIQELENRRKQFNDHIFSEREQLKKQFDVTLASSIHETVRKVGSFEEGLKFLNDQISTGDSQTKEHIKILWLKAWWFEAIRRELVPEVKKIIFLMKDAGITSERRSDGLTGLMLAAQMGNIDIMEIILKEISVGEQERLAVIAITKSAFSLNGDNRVIELLSRYPHNLITAIVRPKPNNIQTNLEKKEEKKAQ